jgi:hypothetical protein
MAGSVNQSHSHRQPRARPRTPPPPSAALDMAGLANMLSGLIDKRREPSWSSAAAPRKPTAAGPLPANPATGPLHSDFVAAHNRAGEVAPRSGTPFGGLSLLGQSRNLARSATTSVHERIVGRPEALSAALRA